MATTGTTGCSWTFQEHETSYGILHEPRCTSVPGLWLWDAASAAAGVVDVIQEAREPSPGALRITAAGVGAALFLLSAVDGHRWANECKSARVDYDAELRSRAPRPPSTAATEAAPFYCAGASTTGVCTRNRAGCDRARDEMLAAPGLIDLPLCAPAGHAWCFDGDAGDEQCFAAREVCTARFAAANPARASCEQRP